MNEDLTYIKGFHDGWQGCLDELQEEVFEEVKNTTDQCRVRALQHVLAVIKKFKTEEKKNESQDL